MNHSEVFLKYISIMGAEYCVAEFESKKMTDEEGFNDYDREFVDAHQSAARALRKLDQDSTLWAHLNAS